MNEYKNLHAIVLKEGSKGSSAYLREEAKDGGAFTLKYYEAASMSDPSGTRSIVDTTGAGDAFTAAFAVRYAETKGDMMDALRYANAMGFLAITRYGCGANCIASRSDISSILAANAPK